MASVPLPASTKKDIAAIDPALSTAIALWLKKRGKVRGAGHAAAQLTAPAAPRWWRGTA
jgi:hypothetical protein